MRNSRYAHLPGMETDEREVIRYESRGNDKINKWRFRNNQEITHSELMRNRSSELINEPEETH